MEQIRNSSIHSTLRLMIDFVAGLALLGIVGAAVVLFTSGHPWLALCNSASVALVYVLRNLAVMVVDVADMLAEQGAKAKVEEENVVA